MENLHVKDNKTFCIVPFVHCQIDTDSSYKPCCVSTTNFPFQKITNQSIEEIHNSDEMKQFRLDLVNGVPRPEICSHCYQGDEANFVSYRQSMNEQLEKFIEPSLEAMKADGTVKPILRSWDIRYSNLCNLKCRTCGDDYSTTWAAEHGIDKELFAFPPNTDPLENQYKNVRKIYFAGGEPLIMPEHYATLKKLIEMGVAKDIILYYNTNLTKLNYNREYLPDYWKEFKQVRLGLSIDHYGDRANYIRHGKVKWNKIEENLKKIISYDNINVSMHITFSVFNIHTLPEMHKYFFENNLIQHIDRLHLNPVYYPTWYSIKILPKDLKVLTQEKIKNHLEWLKDKKLSEWHINEWQTLHDYLNEDFGERQEQEVKNFVFNTLLLDAKRGESFPETFPEYADWWDSINTTKLIPTTNIK